MVGYQFAGLKVEELFSQLTGPAEAKAKGKSALPVVDENAKLGKQIFVWDTNGSGRVAERDLAQERPEGDICQARLLLSVSGFFQGGTDHEWTCGSGHQLSLCAGWSLLPNGLPQELISSTFMSTKVHLRPPRAEDQWVARKGAIISPGGQVAKSIASNIPSSNDNQWFIEIP